MDVLEKHKRYLEHHVPGEVFWGLGVENETYIELFAGKEVAAEFIVKNQKRERYSVNYWTQYKEGRVASTLTKWIKTLPHGPNTPIRLPLLINGHTFTKCDPWGEHRTTYTVNPSPNPKFAGRTLLEALETLEPAVFGPEARDVWWCFDGDTVEFMTQAFRCTTVEQVLLELQTAKERWITALQRGLAALRCERVLKGPVGWPKHNYGLAVFLTNRNNVAIFNNGTYHVNITAPSRLGKDGEIEDWSRFLHIHRQAARLFQWLSPFLVAAYGSGDIFAQLVNDCHHEYPVGSQRLAASRYVSVGTYDTRLMPRGKMLTRPVDEMVPAPTWWHEMYKSRNVAYEKLESIGYDINFNKYPNHGLEFRIFDWVRESALKEVLEVLVALMDRAMLVPRDRDLPYPQTSAVWCKVLGRTVWEGADALLDPRELRIFGAALGISELQQTRSQSQSVLDVYATIRRSWCKHRNGPCSSKLFWHPIAPRLTHMSTELVPAARKGPVSLLSSTRVDECATTTATTTSNTEIHLHHTQSPPHHPTQIQQFDARIVDGVAEGVSPKHCLLPGFFGGRRTMPKPSK